MNMVNGVSASTDTEILSRLIRPEEGNWAEGAAETLLNIRFEKADLDRIHDLVVRNQEDSLSPEERAELEDYLRVSFLLDLMHSKARRSLRAHRSVP